MLRVTLTTFPDRWVIALLAIAIAPSCNSSGNYSSTDNSGPELKTLCEIQGEEVDVDGVLHWSNPGNHSDSIWLQRVIMHSSVNSNNFESEEAKVEESYVVTFSDDFDVLNELRPTDPESGIVLVGTWSGTAGTVQPACAYFRGGADRYKNRLIEIRRVENLRVLEKWHQ